MLGAKRANKANLLVGLRRNQPAYKSSLARKSTGAIVRIASQDELLVDELVGEDRRKPECEHREETDSRLKVGWHISDEGQVGITCSDVDLVHFRRERHSHDDSFHGVVAYDLLPRDGQRPDDALLWGCGGGNDGGSFSFIHAFEACDL